MSYWSAPGDTKPGFDEAVKALERDGKPLRKGHVFGLSWTNHWVKAELNVPEQWRNTSQQLICGWNISSAVVSKSH
jgi:alpha-mannosidase